MLDILVLCQDRTFLVLDNDETVVFPRSFGIIVLQLDSQASIHQALNERFDA